MFNFPAASIEWYAAYKEVVFTKPIIRFASEECLQTVIIEFGCHRSQVQWKNAVELRIWNNKQHMLDNLERGLK